MKKNVVYFAMNYIYVKYTFSKELKLFEIMIVDTQMDHFLVFIHNTMYLPSVVVQILDVSINTFFLN